MKRERGEDKDGKVVLTITSSKGTYNQHEASHIITLPRPVPIPSARECTLKVIQASYWNTVPNIRKGINDSILLQMSKFGTNWTEAQGPYDFSKSPSASNGYVEDTRRNGFTDHDDIWPPNHRNPADPASWHLVYFETQINAYSLFWKRLLITIPEGLYNLDTFIEEFEHQLNLKGFSDLFTWKTNVASQTIAIARYPHQEAEIYSLKIINTPSNCTPIFGLTTDELTERGGVNPANTHTDVDGLVLLPFPGNYTFQGRAKFNSYNAFVLHSTLGAPGISVDGETSGIIASIPNTAAENQLVNFTPSYPLEADGGMLLGSSINTVQSWWTTEDGYTRAPSYEPWSYTVEICWRY